ncbi:hexapeptide transferase [Desulfoluna limicola]|uniref:Hexapeptide transferase n=1 Tax=Desulfoluna limicola TaxID=2810562 RepID=A0ABN6F020_9BACT|nr:acyltransferase [Desulfoluna limicola]BCS94855.1 hexapeptide transferase [Desulfoluna limicola]
MNVFFSIFHSLKLKLRNKLRIDDGNEFYVSPNARVRQCKIQIKGTGNKLHISDNCSVRYANIQIIGTGCEVFIGKNFENAGYCKLSCREKNTKLIIGSDCIFADGVRLLTSDMHDIYENNKRINQATSITIEDNVWIGDGALILKGVDIGSNSVIGARSVVTRDIKPDSISVGNPAQVIKSNIRWTRELTF